MSLIKRPSGGRASAVRKVMLLGQSNVGKTSLANSLAFGRFEMNYKRTIGVELYTADIVFDGSPRRLILWDTDGRIQDEMVASSYCKGAAGACIIADLTRPETIEAARETLEIFEELYPGRPTRLIGNKLDLAPGSVLEDGTCVSVHDGTGVAKVLEEIARECWED